LEAGGQPALEEDEDEGDDPDRARELVVVEVDPAGPVRADRHAQAEEEHEAGQAQSSREQGRAEARRQQRPGGEQEVPDAHTPGG
jgi:hypothetical protein